ncbi:MAG: hypothetical protein RL095_1924 [Verrucomicrobiota bacterium]|jgi:prepilin-type processing-associated H-X9-DG protein
MSEENPSDRVSPWMAIWLGIGVFGFLAALILPALGGPVNQGRPVTKCKNHLKQMGLVIHSYYADGSTLRLPILTDLKISPESGGLGFDANMLSCPARRRGASLHYLWNPQANGALWSDWNHPHSPLIWDAAPHQINGKLSVLMGDGHVEEMEPEQLKKLTQ